MISLRSKLRRQLMSYLYANRSARFYVRELARALSVDSTNLSRELARLEREGLLLSEIEGRQRYYSVNRRYPRLKALFSLLGDSVGLIPTLQSALGPVGNIESAYLFGSFAKKEADAASDIDLLIVGEPNGWSLAAAVSEVERTLRREINYTVLKPEELARRLSEGDPFLSDVWQGERIAVIGQEIGHEPDQAAIA